MTRDSETIMRTSLLIGFAVLLGACGAPSEAPTNVVGQTAAAETGPPSFALTPDQIQGRAIYDTMCWTCHGLSGRGDGPAVDAGSMAPPPTFHTQDFSRATTRELERRFGPLVNEADPGHPHMQYVRSLLKPENFSAALSFVPAISYPPEIPGSAIAGEALYSLRCVGCHGETGQGDGRTAASLVDMPPADFTTDSLLASKDWDRVYDRIREGGRKVHGSSMPPWGVVFTDAETWDLVAYLATFQPGLLSLPPWVD